MSSLLASSRSFLFVPGQRPERFLKALNSGADAVVIDLEDAVPLDAKAHARAAIGQAWNSFDSEQRGRLLVRINPAGTIWYADDLALLGGLPGLAGVMLPKAENPADIAALASVCGHLAIIPLLESAQGFAALEAIARAPQVLRLGLGHIDLQADLGVACDADEAELAPARWAMVCASRSAGLAAPIDGVTADIADADVLARDTQRSRRAGFSAKLCIHPQQIAGVHRAFAPTPQECDWARRVLAGQDQGGVYSVDGRMVDAPVILLAEQMVKRAR
jgi:citrate lyase subunit beta/citryl-CoA lyase